MNNIVTRSITGLVYVGLIVGAILAGGYWMLWLVMLFAFLAINEFTGIANKARIPAVLRALDMSAAGFILLVPYAFIHMEMPKEAVVCLVVFLLLLIARMVAALYLRVDNPLKQTAFSLMAQLYITLPLFFLLFTYYISKPIVLLMFVMIWLNDTGAFCVGSLMGKNKLFERISPKKSWEGFFGGVVFAIAAGVIAYAVWGDKYLPLTGLELAGLGAVVAIFATWGDLFESLIKRTLGIKDSGAILPGHGGILDRIDSLLFVAPAAFIYMAFIYLKLI